MSEFPKRIGLLTGGGDAPGLNAVIRSVVRCAAERGVSCIGLENSFDGLMEKGRTRELTLADVAGIHRAGGTILGTTNHGNPFKYPVEDARTKDYSQPCMETFQRLELDALVVIGETARWRLPTSFTSLACRWWVSRKRSTTILLGQIARSGLIRP